MKRMGSDTMKTLLSYLVGLAMVSPLMAVEYVTLNRANPTYTSNPNDVIQIVAARNSSTNYTPLSIDGVDMAIPPSRYEAGAYEHLSLEGMILHGVTNWSVPGTGAFIIVLRITKPNEGFKSEPMVVPVAQGTSYSVELETSTDMQTWVPAAPGDYASTGTPRFFRVKAAVTPGTP